MRSSTSQGPWVSTRLHSEEEISKEVYSWSPAPTWGSSFPKEKTFYIQVRQALPSSFISATVLHTMYGILTTPFLWEIGLEIVNNYQYFDLNLEKHCEV